MEARQLAVKAEYYRHAGALDQKYHNATPGPFTGILRDYGKNGEVLGLVVGAFGEASEDVYKLRDLAADQLARAHASRFDTTPDIARDLFTYQLNRKWGHTFIRGWARLMLKRLRENVGFAPDSTGHNRHRDAAAENANEQFGFFHPNHPGQGPHLPRGAF